MGIQGLDQLSTYEAMEAFAERFEAQHMKFAPSNRAINDASTALLLSKFPRFTHGLVRMAIRCGPGATLPWGSNAAWRPKTWLYGAPVECSVCPVHAAAFHRERLKRLSESDGSRQQKVMAAASRTSTPVRPGAWSSHSAQRIAAVAVGLPRQRRHHMCSCLQALGSLPGYVCMLHSGQMYDVHVCPGMRWAGTPASRC